MCLNGVSNLINILAVIFFNDAIEWNKNVSGIMKAIDNENVGTHAGQ